MTRLSMLLLTFVSLATLICADEDAEPLSHYEDQGHEITREHLEKLHSHLDGDKDGKVSMQEILKFKNDANKVMYAQEIEEVFHEMESTKDGHLSFEEHMSETDELHENVDASEKAKIKAHEEAKFKAADLNGDGKLDKTELVHLMHPDSHPEVLDLHVTETMRKTDENGDGKISAKEWGEEDDSKSGSYAAEHGEFKDMDLNSDGYLDKDELIHVESGDFHVKDAMTKLLQFFDEDGDKHFTKAELGKVADKLEDHPAHNHFLEWIFHYLGEGEATGKDEM